MTADARPELASLRLLHRHTVEAGQSVVAEIERVGTKEFAYSLPKAVLKVLRATAVAALNELKTLATDPVLSHPKTPTAQWLIAIRTHAAVFQSIHLNLQLVDRVDSPRLPFEIIGAFEGAAQEYVSLLRGLNALATLTGDDLRVHRLRAVDPDDETRAE